MDLAKIRELSVRNEKSPEQIGLKLSEETGEVSQALLSYIGANGSEYKNLGSDDVKEECIDVIMVALSLFYKLGGTSEELSSVLDSKTSKWEEKAFKKSKDEESDKEELSKLISNCVGKKVFYEVVGDGRATTRTATCVSISMRFSTDDHVKDEDIVFVCVSPFGHIIRLTRNEISRFEDQKTSLKRNEK